MNREPLCLVPWLTLLDEGEDYLVVDKPGNLVCHPTKDGPTSSLIGRLRLHFEGHAEIRPSFVNRLDRETSGIVLVAKSGKAHAFFQRALNDGATEKIYLAVIHGVPNREEGVIEQPIGREGTGPVHIRQTVRADGAPSVTHWRRLASANGLSLLEIRPRSGRLHQIRVHLAWLGHPLVGDKIYGPDPRLYLEFIQTGWTPSLEARLLMPRQMLHATALRLKDPVSGQAFHWQAPPPEDMRHFLAPYFDFQSPSLSPYFATNQVAKLKAEG